MTTAHHIWYLWFVCGVQREPTSVLLPIQFGGFCEFVFLAQNEFANGERLGWQEQVNVLWEGEGGNGPALIRNMSSSIDKVYMLSFVERGMSL